MKTNNRIKYIIPCLFACGTFSLTTGVVAAVQSASTDPKTEAQAHKEIQPADFARSWLEQIDAGQYEKSYNQFDGSGKTDRSLADWTTTWSTLQKQFGVINNRQHQKTESCRTLKGLPDGDYTLVTFKASPASMPMLTLFERLVLSKQPDTGAWTVAKEELLFTTSNRDQPDAAFILPGMEQAASGNAAQDNPKADAEGMAQCTATALAWLALVDQGKYNESYVQLPFSLKETCSPDQWKSWIMNHRFDIDSVFEETPIIKREQITDPDKRYSIRRLEQEWENTYGRIVASSSQEDDQEGDARAIQFSTLSSRTNGIMIETVIVYRRTNGVCKVAAYFVEEIAFDTPPLDAYDPFAPAKNKKSGKTPLS